MLRERAVEHFEGNGWSVERDPVVETPVGEFRPTLVVTRDGRRTAVLVDDDPFGVYQIGSFAVHCKKAGIRGVVVCPGTPEVIDACEARGVDHLSPEGLGAPTLVRRAVRPTAAIVPEARSALAAAASAPPAESVGAERGIVWWRWVVVAAIWTAAIYFVVRLLAEIRA